MKQYVIDQLRDDDYSRILDFLNDNAQRSTFGDIFWLDLPEPLYSDVQAAHKECQGYYFAVSLDMTRVELEFLIRSRQTLRCSCVSYANPAQRDYIIGFGDRMLEELGIKI